MQSKGVNRSSAYTSPNKRHQSIIQEQEEGSDSGNDTRQLGVPGSLSKQEYSEGRESQQSESRNNRRTELARKSAKR